MGRYFAPRKVLIALTGGVLVLGIFTAGALALAGQRGGHDGRRSDFLHFSAPAGIVDSCGRVTRRPPFGVSRAPGASRKARAPIPPGAFGPM
jgi:hypothetical protein